MTIIRRRLLHTTYCYRLDWHAQLLINPQLWLVLNLLPLLH